MKKSAILVLSLFLAVAVVAPTVSAQNAPSGVNDLTPDRVRRDLSGHQANKPKPSINRLNNAPASPSAQRLRERVRDHAPRIRHALVLVHRRLTAALARLNRIAVRIDSRLEKLQEQGVDTSAAQLALEDVQTELADLEDQITEFQTQTQTDVNVTAEEATIREQLTDIFHKTRTFIKQLKEIRSDLRDVLELTKELQNARRTDQ